MIELLLRFNDYKLNKTFKHFYGGTLVIFILVSSKVVTLDGSKSFLNKNYYSHKITYAKHHNAQNQLNHINFYHPFQNEFVFLVHYLINYLKLF